VCEFFVNKDLVGLLRAEASEARARETMCMQAFSKIAASEKNILLDCH